MDRLVICMELFVCQIKRSGKFVHTWLASWGHGTVTKRVVVWDFPYIAHGVVTSLLEGECWVGLTSKRLLARRAQYNLVTSETLLKIVALILGKVAP